MQPFPLASSLFCAEDADDVASWDGAEWEYPSSSASPSQVMILPSSFSEPHRPIDDLFATELQHMPRSDYIARFQDGSLDCTARQSAINWILEVHAFYRFLPVTASLAINYLDRFLSSQALPRGLGWPWQLLSVACLSVAAKIEETHVPLLPRTVRRMELLLMAALQWRMRSVTPFDFVSYFGSLLPTDCTEGEGCLPLLRRASNLILVSHHVVDFLGFRPSAVAAAALLCAFGENIEDSSPFFDIVTKEMVDDCRQLFVVYGMVTAAPFKRPAPQSPAGVLDAAACGSCDTQKSASETATPRSPPPPRSGED
ncbi:unnamed protein product [Spirodela intermedia]|uniref:Uncharacterized protein n=1 Tax=Spirodela intermedia TaxID=51605 RepID=A0A7I8IIB5_SPIIN|nr:unnamed protein product [Spirodela intermedia]CAA6657544.1 unnamed protein product [Spirodela intermedia]